MKLRDTLAAIHAIAAPLQDPQVRRVGAIVQYCATFDARDRQGLMTARMLDIQFDLTVKHWTWRTRRRLAAGGIWYETDAAFAELLAHRIYHTRMQLIVRELRDLESLAKIPA